MVKTGSSCIDTDVAGVNITQNALCEMVHHHTVYHYASYPNILYANVY